ncbi:MAG TPA: DNRLRE domain-containing protein, partial [Micromonosporaceae bacterium]
MLKADRRTVRIALALTLVVGLIGVAVTADSARAPGTAGGPGLWDALRGLVGADHGANQRPRVRPRRLTEGAVPRADALPAAVKWPPAKRVRELPERRTANATYYQLSDGRVQADISAAPVNYRDAHGRYQPIDTTVRPSRQDGFVAANTTNTFTTRFGADSTRIVRVSDGDRWVEFGLDGQAHGMTPTISGSTVTYRDAVGGADLVYQVTSRELKENLVLADRPAAGFSATFTLSTHGVHALARDDGSIAFVSDDGRPLFVLPAPYMYDSSKAGAAKTGAAFSNRVTQHLTVSGATATVTVTADSAWLADPARTYPVTIDPTVNIQPVPADGQDVEIYSGSTGTNYNSSYQLKVGTDASYAWRTLVQFPLTGIPTGTTIDSATLSMYYDQTLYTYAYDVSMEARQITTAWDESTATWSNMSGNIAPAPTGNSVTVDDTDTSKIAMKGTWPASTNTSLTPYGINGTYRYNNDTATGDTFTWVPTISEDGNYQVEVHYVSESDRAGSAPYTVYYSGGQKTYSVDQTGSAAGIWKTLGTHPFVAGTTGKIVLGDVSGKAVIADAVRLTKSAVDTKKSGVSSVWNNFSVRDIVQSWVNSPSTNHGLMIKAVDEGTKGRGGPIYEASEYAYQNGGRDYNLPKLTVTFGRQGVTVAQPTTITATGAALNWSAYQDPSSATGDDIVEYQVHRSVHQMFTPSAATLVAPLPPGTTSFQDTTATPTAADTPDTQLGQYYYYMVAVKTADGQVIASPTVGVRLPKAGRITKVYRTSTVDTTLSKALPTTNVDVYDGDHYVSAGNNSSYYGVTRGIVKFPALSDIPSTAQIASAKLRMWTTYDYGAFDGYVDVHKLTRGFSETTATWNNASSTTAWTTPGGDYDPTVLDTVGGNYGITNDPEWEVWDVTSAAQSWLANPSSDYGLLLKMHDESVATQRVMLLSSEGAEPMLRPTLEVTYLEKTPQSTYYAPDTPARMIPGDTYTIAVTVSNPTLSTWAASTWELSYHWTLPDGTDVTTGGNQVATPLPKDIVSGDTVTINATLKTPIQSDSGNKRTDYVLKWELHNKTTDQWLSATDGIASLDQNVAVEDPTSDQLGLEKFYDYTGVSTGAGSSLVNNLHAGNTVWSYNAFANPSRGLSTFVRLSYNSLDSSDTVAGYGWSMQASSLMRLGTPLDFHPNPDPTEVTLTDGDGTSSTFTWDSTAGEWKAPAGVHLYLQRQVVCDPNTEESRAWVLTRPDRTQFFYDCDGYLSSIEDKNGNVMSFTYEERRSQNKPTKFLRYITDATGRQTLTVDYWAKGDTYDYIDDTTWTKVTGQSNLTNPFIIDHVRKVTDISGRTLTFTYTDKGLLGEFVDGSGSSQPKVFAFAYDMTQGNKNVKLVKVTDPRGNATSIAYNYPQTGDDPQFHWTTKSYTDRLGNPTRFAYTDPDGTSGSFVQTVVTDAENHADTELTDGYGRLTQTTNAKNQVTKLNWDADNNVTRVEEPNGAVSTWTYDPKTGYPTEIKNAEANAHGWAGTTLTYQTGLNGHIADLIGKVSPEGRTYTFGYDTEGNLTSVTDPDGNATSTAGDYTTTYTYDTWGELRTSTDADGNTTTYDAFDPSGYPGTITDPLTHTTQLHYDVRGNVTSVIDPLTHETTQAYDTFGRPLDNVQPKDTQAGVYITTPAPVYDANDNVTQTTAANGAVYTATYDADDRLVSSLDPVDNAGDPQRETTYTYDKVGNVLTVTEPNGNLTSDTTDYTTTLAYDEIYEEISTTDAAGNTTTYSYDNVGNLTTVVDPRKNATADTTDYTTKYEYDLNHAPVKVIDAAGNFKTTTYDHDGLVTATTDEDNNTTLYTLDSRGDVIKQQVPHTTNSGGIVYNTTQYEYDQVGNNTKVITPRGVATTTVADDFVSQTTYDKLNRVASQTPPYDPNDSRYNQPNPTTYTYDEAGRLVTVSAPPSNGQSVRNDTRYTYFDNGWTRTSTDPWDIVTSYDYNELGQQTVRTVTSAGGSSSRTMTWSYYPDGKLKARSDDGVPVGLQVVLVDNSDAQNVATSGTWNRSSNGSGYQGYDYATHASGTGADTFTWNLVIPEDGNYTAYVKFPAVSGAASNASYTVNYNGGSASVPVDQTSNAGGWVSLGKYAFSATGSGQKITLSDNANGTVVADAVTLVRDNSADVDNEKKDFTYTYDANGNMTDVGDHSPGAPVDDYVVGYTGLNQVASVVEKLNGVTKHTTSFTYDPNGNTATRDHDSTTATYEYDVRDLLSKVTDKESANDPSPKVTTFTWTASGQVATEKKANNNTVTSAYFLDGALKQQVEKKSDGTLVSQHDYTYDPNGNTLTDAAKTMSADNHSVLVNETTTNTYDPMDRVATSNKSGDHSSSESYVYDANNNVVSQTVGGSTTTSNYDRNRLQSTVVGGITSLYNYDPFGRLDTVTTSGSLTAKYTYDGFDHIASQQNKVGGALTKTNFVYDPFDRTVSQTANVGTSNEKTTTFQYLALSKAVVTEQVNGTTTKTYTYSPWGERLSQVVHKSDGSEEPTYYSYNAHSDVEAVTDANGDTKSTYGYTAYGQDDSAGSTGVDKPDPTNPGKEPYNAYRFNADRWDAASGTYNMGFRTYDPGLNRFLTRDAYNGALADMDLAADPFTGNRYAFAGGNPFSNVEIDGHGWLSTLGHAALDAAGMIPVVGAVADVANGVWYAAEGDWLDAGLSFAGAIPVIGDAAIGARYAVKGAKYAVEGAEAAKDLVHGAEAAEDVYKDAKAADRLANEAKEARQAKEAQAAREAAARKAKQEAAARAEAKAEATAEQKAEQAASNCMHSFAPDTPVLMADGTTRPIKDIAVGDQVESTDPATGETTAEPVVALHRNHDTDMTDVSVTTTSTSTSVASASESGHREQPAAESRRQQRTRAHSSASTTTSGGATTLHTTTHHPFYDLSTHRFVQAGDLRPGKSTLVAPDGTTLTVTAVHTWTGTGTDMRDLTVNRIHTYYVVAAGLPILVHNCDVGEVPYGSNDLSKVAYDHRMQEGVEAGRNIAVFEYRNAEGGLSLVSAANSGGKHSEEIIHEFLQGEGIDPEA